MSPSEFDLRAALRDGEGDTVNPDSIISAARSARHDRRVRVGSAIGAVLVVAGVGIGVGVANLRSSGTPTAAGTTSSSGTTGPATNRSTTTGSQTSTTQARSVQAALASVKCPGTPDRFMVPGGGGTSQFGGSGPLFGEPVAAMRICTFWSGVEARQRSFVLTAGAAQIVATSLNDAPTSLGGRMCPDIATENHLTLELFGITADGKTLPPVTAEPGCRTRSTNGTAVRFGWVPPTSLVRLLQVEPTH